MFARFDRQAPRRDPGQALQKAVPQAFEQAAQQAGEQALGPAIRTPYSPSKSSMKLSAVSGLLISSLAGPESIQGDGECGVFSLKHKQPFGLSVWTARRAPRPASLRRAHRQRPFPR